MRKVVSGAFLPVYYDVEDGPGWRTPLTICPGESPANKREAPTINLYEEGDLRGFLAQARAWGWVMESGELTGTGLGHVRELPGGIAIERLCESEVLGYGDLIAATS